jgi:hypothetical protein
MLNKLDQSKDNVNSKVVVKANNSVGGCPWDLAITEARRRIADLKFSIKDFQKRKERGDRWLGLKEEKP